LVAGRRPVIRERSLARLWGWSMGMERAVAGAERRARVPVGRGPRSRSFHAVGARLHRRPTERPGGDGGRCGRERVWRQRRARPSRAAAARLRWLGSAARPGPAQSTAAVAAVSAWSRPASETMRETDPCRWSAWRAGRLPGRRCPRPPAAASSQCEAPSCAAPAAGQSARPDPGSRIGGSPARFGRTGAAACESRRRRLPMSWRERDWLPQRGAGRSGLRLRYYRQNRPIRCRASAFRAAPLVLFPEHPSAWNRFGAGGAKQPVCLERAMCLA